MVSSPQDRRVVTALAVVAVLVLAVTAVRSGTGGNVSEVSLGAGGAAGDGQAATLAWPLQVGYVIEHLAEDGSVLWLERHEFRAQGWDRWTDVLLAVEQVGADVPACPTSGAGLPSEGEAAAETDACAPLYAVGQVQQYRPDEYSSTSLTDVTALSAASGWADAAFQTVAGTVVPSAEVSATDPAQRGRIVPNRMMVPIRPDDEVGPEQQTTVIDSAGAADVARRLGLAESDVTERMVEFAYCPAQDPNVCTATDQTSIRRIVSEVRTGLPLEVTLTEPGSAGLRLLVTGVRTQP